MVVVVDGDVGAVGGVEAGTSFRTIVVAASRQTVRDAGCEFHASKTGPLQRAVVIVVVPGTVWVLRPLKRAHCCTE